VYTHWLQTICIDTMSKHLPILDMCPWPFENMLYRGACRDTCRDSPLRQPFHTAPRRDLKTKEERRFAKNEYQKLRFNIFTDSERAGLYRKKNDGDVSCRRTSTKIASAIRLRSTSIPQKAHGPQNSTIICLIVIFRK
jgi:hypothetical protein